MAKAASSIDTCQFKSMNADGAEGASTDSVQTCATFKPLYSGEINNEASDHGSEHANDHNNPEALLQEAYQNGFQKGQQQGCQEALSMAKASMSPGLIAFMTSFKNLRHQSELLKSTTADNVIELALLIVNKILDQPCVSTDQDLDELKTTITNALMETNRLSLNMNPDDFSELESILAEDDLDLTSQPQITFNQNSAIHPGELRVDIQSEALESVDQKILDALALILSKASAVS